MPQFSTPLSGLSANSQALSVISNNLANLNTPGYKGQNVTFRDLFYQSIGSTGSGDPIQVGGGSAVGSITSNFNSNSSEGTGVWTDVAINGDGFFVTGDNGTRRYTRAGNFKTGDDGILTTQAGEDVLGYVATNGVIGSTQTLSAIQLSRGLTSPAKATTQVALGVNLNSGTTTGKVWNAPVTVYDSLGNEHVLQFAFTRGAVNPATSESTWSYEVSLPASDYPSVAFNAATDYAAGDVVTYKNVTYYATGNPAVGALPDAGGAWSTQRPLKTGELTFNGDGQLIRTADVGGGNPVNPPANIASIAASGFANGASPLNLRWNILDANGVPTLTQTGATSGASTQHADGYPSGTLDKYMINADGTVTAKFTNGENRVVAQVALANFANNQGLLRVGDNAFEETLASGAAVIGAPKTGGRGSLDGSRLETSNVDIAQEFSKMIVAQRGFQANAKVITAFDEVTQSTINMK